MHIITTHLEWDPSALSTVTCLDIYIYSFTWPLKKCGVFLLHQDYSVFKVYCCWFPNIKVSLNPEKLITELGGQLCLGWDRIWGFDQTVMEAKALWKLLSFTVWAVNQPPPEGSKLPLNSAPFSVFFNIIHFMSGLCSIAPSLVYYWKAISPQLKCSLLFHFHFTLSRRQDTSFSFRLFFRFCGFNWSNKFSTLFENYLL